MKRQILKLIKEKKGKIKFPLVPILLSFILLVGFALRIYGLNWDAGYHLHPDERMIVMVAERLRLPSSLSLKEFLSPQSPLNPKFFAYGSLPLYFLKFCSWVLSFFLKGAPFSYSNLPILGRTLSALFDLGTIWLIFKIGKQLFGNRAALLASFFYAVCVFPIQASHFYAVDVMLNFFIWLTLWQLLNFYLDPKFGSALKVGLSFGLALATKVSATVLAAAIGTGLIVDLVLIGFKFWRGRNDRWWQKLFLTIKKSTRKKWLFSLAKRLFWFGGLIGLVTVLTFLIFEPYALIDFAAFKRQITEQHRMTKDANVFPYTLQYVGTMPFVYPVKNLVFWGMGIGLGSLSIFAFAWYLFDLIKRVFTKGDYDRESGELIVFAFALAYFLVVGRFAVKFMRYLLPLYPFLVLIAANFLFSFKSKKFFLARNIALSLVLVFQLFWTGAFISIYSRPHSRVEASDWINQQVKPGSVLAVEHWDDSLPLFGGEKFEFVSMPMYDPDTLEEKWMTVERNLERADYIILSSNRLYTPLQKLSDCQLFLRCFPKTAGYYRDLFDGKLGFKKVAEFSSYPRLSFAGMKIEINDQSADESFTVYDHPKVTIFKKVEAR